MKLSLVGFKQIAAQPLLLRKEQEFVIISQDDYRKKLLGCFLGKNIGGTLGAPFEWHRQVNHVSYYTQELDGNPLPNDDLDIQLLWLVALEEKGIDIDANTLGEYWLTYVTPHWSEYGQCKINMRAGLQAPVCGSFYNEFRDSCGAFIRSEIWACIAPGQPAIATRYAYEDAILDHGSGEGTYAEIFCAALESAAFVENDIPTLINIGLSYIPEDCSTAKAVMLVCKCFSEGMNYIETRHELLRQFRGAICGVNPVMGSKEDYERGLWDGKIGFDAPSNVGIIAIGLLYGSADFDKAICYAVNCGEDTDCTAATVGAIYGIIHGADQIPEKWIRPIGSGIKTACLNLGELGGYGGEIPQDVYELADRIINLGMQVSLAYNNGIRITSDSTDITHLNESSLYCTDSGIFTEMMNGPIFRFDSFDIQVIYNGDPVLKNNEDKKITIRICNKYKITDTLDVKLWCEDYLNILPSKTGKILVRTAYFRGVDFRGNLETIDFIFSSDYIPEPIVRCKVQFTVPGRHTDMVVPIVLLNGNLQSFNEDYEYKF